MPRPCKEVHPVLSPSTCKICYWCASLSATGEAYRSAWGEPEPTPTIKANRRPAARHPGGVIVPQPPPLDLSPRNKIALVTVAVGEMGNSLLAISRPFMEEYSRRLGTDFVILNWPGHPDWSMSCKFAISRVLDHYERIIYVDVDVMLRPGCIDLLSTCPVGSFWAADDAIYPNLHKRGGVLDEYRAFLQDHRITTSPGHLQYLNTGIFLAERCHAAILLPPVYALPIHHLGEQNYINAMLLQEKVNISTLPRESNWQEWTDKGFRGSPPNAILHLAGMKGNARLALMREIASPDWKPARAVTATTTTVPKGDTLPKPRMSISQLAAQKRR